MSYPVVTEAFRLTIHVMANRNDWYSENMEQYNVRGLLCDNQDDSYSLGSVYYQTRFDIVPAGAFATFQNQNYNYPDFTYQDYVTGPAAKVTFGRPSSDVESIGVIAYDEYADETYGTVHSEPISNLDFSASDPSTVAFTSSIDMYTSANHSVGFRPSWIAIQTGPISGGSTSKLASLNYTTNSGQVSYSATRSFPLLDYQFYDTDYAQASDYAFVYVTYVGSRLPNAGSGQKPGTTGSRVYVTSGQFNHTAEQFFHYA